MGVCKLWFVLLLLLPAYNTSEAILVKTTGREPYVTPICTNDTMNIVKLIICKIRTEREDCHLTYQYGNGFQHGCDSRFTLMKESQTVFLHLTSLTPVDSGNYSCECSRPGGTSTLRLNITVEEDEEEVINFRILFIVVGGVAAYLLLTGVILGFILNNCRNCSRTDTSGLSVCETSGSLVQDDPDDPYTSLQLQPGNDIYTTITFRHHQHDAETNSAGNIVELDDLEDGRETDPSYEIYENI